jgi:hypothetical protein
MKIAPFEISPFVALFFQTPVNMYPIHNPSDDESPQHNPNSPRGASTEGSEPRKTPHSDYLDRISELQSKLLSVRNLVAGALSKAKRAEDRENYILDLVSEASVTLQCKCRRAPECLFACIFPILKLCCFSSGIQLNPLTEEERVSTRINMLTELSAGTGADFWTDPRTGGAELWCYSKIMPIRPIGLLNHFAAFYQ